MKRKEEMRYFVLRLVQQGEKKYEIPTVEL